LISVNFTLLVQLANFLILLVILNYLLFKPILRVLDEREKLVNESAETKERLGRLTSESIEEYESKLLSAKQEAMGIRVAERTAAMADFRQTIQEGRVVGTQDLDKARQEIALEAERSRKKLMADAQTLAADIASRLVGRKL
jgi:F-type H+-transporting ATPase subunit b